MKRSRPLPRVAILGCGRVGRALAVQLLDPERPAAIRGRLRVWSRSSRSVAGLRKLLIGRERKNERRLEVLGSAAEALAAADVVLLCVGDDALAPLVRALARSQRSALGPVVLSTNGYQSIDVLAPLRGIGCALGRLHPLAPVPSGLERTSLTGVPFGIEGDPRATLAARNLVAGIAGSALMLNRRRGSPQAYHAGASLLSGGLVALFHLAERVMEPSVRSRADLRKALSVFADRTRRSTAALGPEDALTGALARGSETIVRGHLAALGKVRDARAAYCLLGRTMLELAHARGSIDRATRSRLRGLLDPSVKGARRRDRSRGD